MNDHDRLAHALGRFAAARSASERRNGPAGSRNAELLAARAAFEEEARRSGLSDEEFARIVMVLAGSWRVDGCDAAGGPDQWRQGAPSAARPRFR